MTYFLVIYPKFVSFFTPKILLTFFIKKIFYGISDDPRVDARSLGTLRTPLCMPLGHQLIHEHCVEWNGLYKGR